MFVIESGSIEAMYDLFADAAKVWYIHKDAKSARLPIMPFHDAQRCHAKQHKATKYMQENNANMNSSICMCNQKSNAMLETLPSLLDIHENIRMKAIARFPPFPGVRVTDI